MIRHGAKAPGATTLLEAHELLKRLNRDKRPDTGRVKTRIRLRKQALDYHRRDFMRPAPSRGRNDNKHHGQRALVRLRDRAHALAILRDNCRFAPIRQDEGYTPTGPR